jgi:2-phosphoglycerate kinase
MSSVDRKIMGMPINIIDNINSNITEFDANCAVDLANRIYEEVQKENSDIVDSSKLRAIAVFRIVLELQTIKGKQEVFLDTNSRRMNELIKLADSIESPI